MRDADTNRTMLLHLPFIIHFLPFTEVPDNCPTGYYGTLCTGKCNCNDCDQTYGCLEKTCFQGFFGPNCEDDCHCLNGVACDRVTGKCAADWNTGLSLCEPGYVSSTGINLNNCQKCKFTKSFIY